MADSTVVPDRPPAPPPQPPKRPASACFLVVDSRDAAITSITLSNGATMNLLAFDRLVNCSGLSFRRVAEVLGVSDVELEEILRDLFGGHKVEIAKQLTAIAPDQGAPLTRGDLDWASSQIDIQFLLRKLSERDRLIGRLEEFVQEHVPFADQGSLEEMLKAIDALYGGKDAR